jgi:hypothetical protein
VYASGVFTPQNATQGSTGFNYTGGEQTFAVPACMTTIYVIADGAAGGSFLGWSGATGGFGGETGATIPTSPGETLHILVGDAGQSVDTSAPGGAGGYNGGGAGAPYDPSECEPGLTAYFPGPGGGGGTDIRQNGDSLSNCVVVAGEGGASQTSGGVGGAGDNPGQTGVGGAGEGWCFVGLPGQLAFSAFGSGGAGGGWYGGGGGGLAGLYNGGGAGGGGSAYAEPSATNVYELGGLLNNSGKWDSSLFAGVTAIRCAARPLTRRS